MSEEDLTELAGDGLTIQKKAHLDVFQAQPLQRFGVAFFDHQGYQGWPDRYDGMPKGFGQVVTIALGTADTEDCLALDADFSGLVTVDELIAAVNAALEGCPL